MTILHAIVTALLAERIRSHPPKLRNGWYRTAFIVFVIIWFFLAIAAECWLWAALLWALGAFDDLETALYFSTVTYTTLGYGDVVLGEGLRLLGAFAAANGTIIIGGTTAMVFLAVQRIYGLDKRLTED